jgi:hypothetical protein
MRARFVGVLALCAWAACSHDGGTTQEEWIRPTSELYGASSGVREGAITAVANDHIVLKDGLGPIAVVQYGRDTDFVRRGAKIPAGDIHEGTPVRVFFSGSGPDEQALRVEVLEGTEASEVLRQLERGH